MRTCDIGIRRISSFLPLAVGCLAAACSGSSASHIHFASAAGAAAETLAPRSAGAEAADAPGGLIPSLAPLAKRVTPAVVSIESLFGADTTEIASNQGPEFPPGVLPPGLLPPNMSPFGQPQEQGPTGALGTGFIVSGDGYILTNNHVVANAERVTVGLPDRRIFTAKVIGHDPGTDVALIKIDATNLPTLPLGSDSTAQVGDAVMAVGNPLGLDFTVTSGIISAKGRSEQLSSLFTTRYSVVDFIQTDAVINPGNSGGPLVDMNGNVIGINSAIASPTGSFAGYGFAVPISIARIVMTDLQKYGRVRHAILGLTIQDVGPADARAAGLKDIQGVLVGSVNQDGPAAKAGIKPGDVITAINGQPIDRMSTLQRLVFGYQPGTTVTLDISRYGERRTAQVTLGEPPSERETASNGGGKATGPAALGIGVLPVTPQVAERLQLPAGTTGLLVEQVDPTGPASGPHGLQQGDIIEQILGRGTAEPVHTVQDLRDALEHSAGVVSLLVYNQQVGGTRVVNIQTAR
jgi:serine protease Do